MKMTSYVLPSTNPARGALELIFRSPSVISNESTFCAAGFQIQVRKSRSLMRVAIHPSVPQYLFKVYFVDERRCDREKPQGWEGFVNRCRNAEKIRQIIRGCRLRYFQVPHKWLFVPSIQHPDCSRDDQPVVLVAERLDLVPDAENEQAWLHSITERHLDELYIILQAAGGSSYRPDNVRQAKQGKFAFIDTEHAGDERDYESITQYLTPRMREYWLVLNKRTTRAPNEQAGARRIVCSNSSWSR